MALGVMLLIQLDRPFTRRPEALEKKSSAAPSSQFSGPAPPSLAASWPWEPLNPPSASGWASGRWETSAAQAQWGGHSQKSPGPARQLLCFRTLTTWNLTSHRRRGDFDHRFFFRVPCCVLRVSGTRPRKNPLGSPRRRLRRRSWRP